MPNWTTTRMVVHTDDVRKLTNDRGDVDFELFRPMPDDLYLVEGSYTHAAIDAARARRHGDPERMERVVDEIGLDRLASGIDLGADGHPRVVSDLDGLCDAGDAYLENERRYGAINWYGWRTRNWGTKWNACETTVEPHGDSAIVQFLTAWDAPDAGLCVEMIRACDHPVIMEHADEDFTCVYTTSITRYGLPARRYLDADEACELFDTCEVSEDGYEWTTFDPLTPDDDFLNAFVSPMVRKVDDGGKLAAGVGRSVGQTDASSPTSLAAAAKLVAAGTVEEVASIGKHQ